MPNAYKARQISITTVGGAGAATGATSQTLGEYGGAARLVKAWAHYVSAPPATTVFTIKDTLTGRTVYTSAATATDFETALIDEICGGSITVTVTLSNALAPALTITLFLET
jgi:hypothetical protein